MKTMRKKRKGGVSERDALKQQRIRLRTLLSALVAHDRSVEDRQYVANQIQEIERRIRTPNITYSPRNFINNRIEELERFVISYERDHPQEFHSTHSDTGSTRSSEGTRSRTNSEDFNSARSTNTSDFNSARGSVGTNTSDFNSARGPRSRASSGSTPPNTPPARAQSPRSTSRTVSHRTPHLRGSVHSSPASTHRIPSGRAPLLEAEPAGPTERSAESPLHRQLSFNLSAESGSSESRNNVSSASSESDRNLMSPAGTNLVPEAFNGLISPEGAVSALANAHGNVLQEAHEHISDAVSETADTVHPDNLADLAERHLIPAARRYIPLPPPTTPTGFNLFDSHRRRMDENIRSIEQNVPVTLQPETHVDLGTIPVDAIHHALDNAPAQIAQLPDAAIEAGQAAFNGVHDAVEEATNQILPQDAQEAVTFLQRKEVQWLNHLQQIRNELTRLNNIENPSNIDLEDIREYTSRINKDTDELYRVQRALRDARNRLALSPPAPRGPRKTVRNTIIPRQISAQFNRFGAPITNTIIPPARIRTRRNWFPNLGVPLTTDQFNRMKRGIIPDVQRNLEPLIQEPPMSALNEAANNVVPTPIAPPRSSSRQNPADVMADAVHDAVNNVAPEPPPRSSSLPTDDTDSLLNRIQNGVNQTVGMVQQHMENAHPDGSSNESEIPRAVRQAANNVQEELRRHGITINQNNHPQNLLPDLRNLFQEFMGQNRPPAPPPPPPPAAAAPAAPRPLGVERIIAPEVAEEVQQVANQAMNEWNRAGGAIWGFIRTLFLFFPNSIVLFGIILDCINQEFRFTIASIIGVGGVFVNWLIGFLAKKDAEMGQFQGCTIPGFTTFESPLAPQGIVLPMSIFVYLLMDLANRRSASENVGTALLMLGLIGIHAAVLFAGNCGQYYIFKNIIVLTLVAMGIGFTFGIAGWYTVAMVAKDKLPFAKMFPTSTPASNAVAHTETGTCSTTDQDNYVCEVS